MNEAEKAILKDILKLLAEVELPAIVEVELKKIPEPYNLVVKGVWEALKPQLLAAIDKKIEEI